VTGYEPAQKLAGKVVKFLKDHACYYDAEGRFLWSHTDRVEGEAFGGHFHNHAIGLAAKLSTAGVGDYWDDIDRWARNQFAENQLTEGEWICRLAESMPKKPVEYNETADQVAKRNLGGFAGWASGNEWALRTGIIHCCTRNSTRSLYYIWENIVECEGDEFQVNLLLNRASA